MALIVSLSPWLLAMLALICCSAFFSASEAALFSLRIQDRKMLQAGNRPQRLAASLLEEPDRLLSAVLFWNLVVNMAYFAVASIVGFWLQRHASAGESIAYVFAAGSLLSIIFFSEMLPKTLGIFANRRLAGPLGGPLMIAVKIVDPLMPILRLVNLLSRRLFFPRFRTEPYLKLSDLERAIEISTEDEHLVEQERMVLNNIVTMSDIRVDEWMRPRRQFLSFRPPVALADLENKMTPSGYLLVTDPETDEVAASIDLRVLSFVPAQELERFAQPVAYLPWCATVADAFQQMRQERHTVVAVVNEFGETIGILTHEDILDTVFTNQPSWSGPLSNRNEIREAGPDTWHVTGVTSLRRLARHLKMELPSSKNTTIAGVIQEELQRLPEQGDAGHWGPFRFRVLETAGRAQILVELQRIDARPREGTR